MLHILVLLFLITSDCFSEDLLNKNMEPCKQSDVSAQMQFNPNQPPDSELHCIIDCYRCCVGAFSKENDKCKRYKNYNRGKNCKCEKSIED